MESEGRIVVHTHRRAAEGDAYGPNRRFDTIVKIDEPWPIELPIGQITPRFCRPDPDSD